MNSPYAFDPTIEARASIDYVTIGNGETQLRRTWHAPNARGVVVIVHGSQDNNATATVLWDNAFAEPVSWRLLYCRFPQWASYISPVETVTIF